MITLRRGPIRPGFLFDLLLRMRALDAARIETTEQHEENWARHVTEVAHTTLYPKAASWYMGANIPGKPRVFMPFIGVDSYRKTYNEIAAADYPGFELSGDAVASDTATQA